MASHSPSSKTAHRNAMAAVFLAVFVTIASSSQADDSGAPADLYVMKTPDSPAFVALGVAPQEVQRPTNPSAFATSVVSAFEQEGSSITIPQALAVEVAPYWMAPRYDLDFFEYGNEGLESIYRNGTISFATTGGETSATEQADAEDAEKEVEPKPGTGSNVALGLRTTVLHPKLSKDKNSCAQQIHQALNKAALVDAQALNAEVRRRAGLAWTDKGKPIPSTSNGPQKPAPPEEPTKLDPPVPPQPPLNPNDLAALASFRIALAEYEAAVRNYSAYRAELARHERALKEYQQTALPAWENARDAHLADLRQLNDTSLKLVPVVQAELQAKAKAEAIAAVDPAYDACLRVLQARGDGISVDIASAFGWRFPGAQFDNGRFDRAFAWLTASYTAAGTSFLGLIRYLGERPDQEFRHGYDVGGRVLYASDRWGVSGEYVRRKVKTESRVETRFALSLDYRVAGDTWLTAVFGKDYGPGSEGAALALANLEFNLGGQRLKPLEQTVK